MPDYAIFGGVLRSQLDFPELVPTTAGSARWALQVAHDLSETSDSVAMGSEEVEPGIRVTLWRHARGLLVASHFHDWSRDPFFRGAYSYQVVGGANAPSRLARPVEDTLYFAGEATIAEMSGTVPAAVVSGRRAARRVLSGRDRRS